MKEIWKASASPRAWKRQSVPLLLEWWWFLWIICILLEIAHIVVLLKADQIYELTTVSVLASLCNITLIPLTLIVVVIVSKICGMQTVYYSRHG